MGKNSKNFKKTCIHLPVLISIAFYSHHCENNSQFNITDSPLQYNFLRSLLRHRMLSLTVASLLYIICSCQSLHTLRHFETEASVLYHCGFDFQKIFRRIRVPKLLPPIEDSVFAKDLSFICISTLFPPIEKV